MDRDEIMRRLRAFESAGLEYVLIGAAAMGFHGLIRATPAFDLIIRATPDNIEKLRAALRAAYKGDPSIDEISTTDLLGEYPMVRYVPPTGDLFFDVMTRLVPKYSSVIELFGFNLRITIRGVRIAAGIGWLDTKGRRKRRAGLKTVSAENSYPNGSSSKQSQRRSGYEPLT
jgi:hypothetical protein